ncbi:MAG: hypothetical protein COT00_05240, partial [Candidatus Omnitrophica bacterium CG07_land_8_20_14_0_80_50_8]
MRNIPMGTPRSQTSERGEGARLASSVQPDLVQKIIDSPYLRDSFETILLGATLKGFYLATEDEIRTLRTTVITHDAEAVHGMRFKNPRATEVVVQFFNTVNLYEEAEFQEIKRRMTDPVERYKLLPLITKITAATQQGAVPRAGLDSGDIRSPFRIMKEAFAGDWKVYLTYLVPSLSEEDISAFVKTYGNPEMTFEDTLRCFIRDGTVMPTRPGAVEPFSDRGEFNSAYGTAESVKAAFCGVLNDLTDFGELAFLAREDLLKLAADLGVALDKESLKENNQTKLFAYISKEIKKHVYANRNDLTDLQARLFEIMLARRLIHQWIMLRADNVCKTAITSTTSSREAYRVFLKNVFDRDFSDEDMMEFHRGILSYTPSSPRAKKVDSCPPLMSVLIQTQGWKPATWADGAPKHEPLLIADANDHPDVLGSGWGYKVDNWTYAMRHIDEPDAVILNLDWEHTVLPVDVMFLPFVAYEFTERPDLGIVLTRLRDADRAMTPVARNQEVAENVWNTRILPAVARIAATALYGPGIGRKAIFQGYGVPDNKIEDSVTAQEALKDGWKTDYAPGITLSRGREKTQGGMPAFVNRFGGLTLENWLTVHYQQLVKSVRVHITEKLGLMINDDHYLNQVFIPRYNLIVYVFAFFVSFTPYAYLALPFLFVTLQYALSQANASGGVRDYTNRYGRFWGLVHYGRKCFWSLVNTFIPLVLNDSQKTINALGGNSGQFIGGDKKVEWKSENFFTNIDSNDKRQPALYPKYREAVKWGLVLLTIFLFAPIHPLGIACQFLFYVMPFAMIFGGFMHNAQPRPVLTGLIKILGLGTVIATYFGPHIAIPYYLAYAALIAVLGITGYESASKAIVWGVAAVAYFLFADLPVSIAKWFWQPVQMIVTWIARRTLAPVLMKMFPKYDERRNWIERRVAATLEKLAPAKVLRPWLKETSPSIWSRIRGAFRRTPRASAGPAMPPAPPPSTSTPPPSAGARLSQTELAENRQLLFSFLAERNVPEINRENLERYFGAPKADVILMLGHIDLRVPVEVARLYREGYAKKVVVSGFRGHGTPITMRRVRALPDYASYGFPANLDMASEAEVFKRILMKNGVPEEDILIEDRSTSTAQNIQNTQALFEAHPEIPHKNVILMTFPVSQRRAAATFRKFYTAGGVTLLSYSAFVPGASSTTGQELDDMTDWAMGDVSRLAVQTGLGLTEPVELPEEVMVAYDKLYNHLKAAGFPGPNFGRSLPKNELIRRMQEDASGARLAQAPGAEQTGLGLKDQYLTEINGRAAQGELSSLPNEAIRFDMDETDEAWYLQAIRNEMALSGETVITPGLLFRAAKQAIGDKVSTAEGRIGLQPGTMNPLTYGHMTASLAAILGQDLNAVIMANGGTVPDKPYASAADTRNKMAEIAAEEVAPWLKVTAIRGQIVEMFEREGALSLAGTNATKQRFNMDMAAFIWLFTANPNIEWFYLVGSDKVAEYGKKDEQGLLTQTLLPAKVKVVYFGRTGQRIKVAENIKPFAWLWKLWNRNFFIKSRFRSFEDISATKVR